MFSITLVALTLTAATYPPGPRSSATGASGRADVIDPGETIELQHNQAVFWTGPYVDETRRVPGPPKSIDATWEWFVDVPERVWRLRVGIDHPDQSDTFQIDLYDPAGAWRAWALTDYDTSEAMVWDPATEDSSVPPGRWRILVTAIEVTDSAFQLRARAETEPGRPLNGASLLPNLRAEPPFDLTFRVVPPRTTMTDQQTERAAPIDCLPDETVEDRVARCLRFGFGYYNTGDGPYELRLTPDPAPDEDGQLTAKVTQRMYIADDTPWDFIDNDHNGSFEDRDAGTATFHRTHGHWHYDDIITAELFRLVDGDLELMGEAAKRGACAHDWDMADFHRFYQDEGGRHDSSRGGDDRCDSLVPVHNLPTETVLAIALSPGWGDVYPSYASDNYVGFPPAGDGKYVLRLTIDGADQIEETSEHDNVGYAHFVVQGGEIELVERGRGSDPWDPRKVVLSHTGLGS